MKKITETDYLVDSREINTEFEGTRYNGGWAKEITGLDKTKSNGYSLQGDFVDGGKTGDYRVTEGHLYLDCDIQGSRKNQRKEYTLFTIRHGEIIVLSSINGGRTNNWAIDMWPAIDDFFTVDQPEQESPLAHISTEDLLAELARRERKINTEIRHRIMTVREFIELYDEGQIDSPNCWDDIEDRVSLDTIIELRDNGTVYISGGGGYLGEWVIKFK